MSFEIFVRTWVNPAIRPLAKPPVLPFQDTPDQGVAVLRGLGGKLIDLTFSETQGWSKGYGAETKRKVDVERVYQKEQGGGINRENYVDIERVKELHMQEDAGPVKKYFYADPPMADNIEVLEKDKWIEPPTSGGGAAP